MSDPAGCPICGSLSSWPLPFNDRDTQRVVMPREGYFWRVCTQCGNAYPSAEQSLEDLQRYWNMNRLEGLSATELAALWDKRMDYARYWAEATWSFLAPLISGKQGRFLDIACGLGATVRKFQDMGWVAKGIDADPNTAEFHQRLGVDCVIGQFENEQAADSYDLVSIAHAIYFVTQPRDFLLRVRNSLKPGGLFLVINSDFVSPLDDNNPSQVHSWYPTRSSMINALRLTGFEILRSERHRGSILIVARCAEPQPARRGWVDLLALRFHHAAYRLIGRPLSVLVQAIKRARLFRI